MSGAGSPSQMVPRSSPGALLGGSPHLWMLLLARPPPAQLVPGVLEPFRGLPGVRLRLSSQRGSLCPAGQELQHWPGGRFECATCPYRLAYDCCLSASLCARLGRRFTCFACHCSSDYCSSSSPCAWRGGRFQCCSRWSGSTRSGSSSWSLWLLSLHCPWLDLHPWISPCTVLLYHLAPPFLEELDDMGLCRPLP